MLKITNVKVSLNEKRYCKVISQVLNMREKEIRNVKLIKQSIDARRSQVHYICSFIFEVDNEEKVLNKYKNVSKYIPYVYQYFSPVNRKVLIVGCGPAGLFCAYTLSKSGMKVDVIERGKCIEERIKDVDLLMNQRILNEESNIAFGEGGAGTFSDGKLTTGTKNPRISLVLETFVKYGAPEDILYLAKPHIGTDYLRKVIVNMRKDIEMMGSNIEFETKYIDLKKVDNGYMVTIEKNGIKEERLYDDVVLGIGHSARDTYESLYHNELIKMIPKSFAVGVRIEQSQQRINEIQYHKYANHPALKAANYKLAVRTSEKRGVYTFCMCPGGYIVPSVSEKGYLCINGMSEYKRDGSHANSAILVTVDPSDYGNNDVLAGIEFQRKIEKKAFEIAGSNYNAPVSFVNDYLNNQASISLNDLISTYKPGITLCNLNDIFPEFINRNLKEGLQLMNKKMPGFIDDETLLVGVETRSSSPVRIMRNEDYHVDNEYIYPIGEGAGMSGGIISSAVDGIVCAEKILSIKH